MNWQDIVFFTGSLVFVIALIPALRSSDKPPLATCATTAATLAVFALTYASMHFWFSALITTATASCWATLGFQSQRQKVKK